jgi:hypothetical protein
VKSTVANAVRPSRLIDAAPLLAVFVTLYTVALTTGPEIGRAHV